MQTTNADRATDWLRDRPRTLIAKDGAVWLWPGIPLAIEQNGTVQPLPARWIRSWITALHGFEAQHKPLESALDRAARHLTQGDEHAAQAELDAANMDHLSPEGGVLMRTVAGDLGIAPLAMPIGTKSIPWGTGDHIAQRALFHRFAGAASIFEKAGNPNQPRWPKGAPSSEGGRYAPSNAGAGSSGATGKPGIGHNGGPPLDDPPEIPQEEPPTIQLRNMIVKDLARWLLRRGAVALIPGIGEAVTVVQLGVWIYESLPFINAYLDRPKTLDELNDAANEPKKGYDIHHIAEQQSAEDDGFSKEQIESRENRVRISTLKHWEINGWYGTPNKNYGGLSPRQYLQGKDWAERVRVGRQALIDAGVLQL